MSERERCEHWMPRAGERCAIGAGHRTGHRTEASWARMREQVAAREATPEGRAAKHERRTSPEQRERDRAYNRKRRAEDPWYALRETQWHRERRASEAEARLREQHPNVGTDNLRLKPLD